MITHTHIHIHIHIHMLAYMYQWFQWWRYTRERFQIRIS